MTTNVVTSHHSLFFDQMRMMLEIQSKFSDEQWESIESYMNFNSAKNKEIILRHGQAESCARFIDFEKIDCTPTSEYIIK